MVIIVPYKSIVLDLIFHFCWIQSKESAGRTSGEIESSEAQKLYSVILDDSTKHISFIYIIAAMFGDLAHSFGNMHPMVPTARKVSWIAKYATW